jgi:hypothetical protein
MTFTVLLEERVNPETVLGLQREQFHLLGGLNVIDFGCVLILELQLTANHVNHGLVKYARLAGMLHDFTWRIADLLYTIKQFRDEMLTKLLF